MLEEVPDKDSINRELDELREHVRDYSFDEIKDGSWFVRFLAHALRQYAQTVDAEWFRRKYPNLPADAIAERRIDLAKRYAALEGALSAGAYSAMVAATIGSSGGASPGAIPAGVASFCVDLFYTSRLQLRLAYDLSVLYGHPIDLDDSEDLIDLMKVAFGVKTGEAFSAALGKLAPEATRVGVKAVLKGSTLAWLKGLPVIGKSLLQRNLIKFAIPVVSIPISAGFNHFSTGSIGKLAKRTYRDKAAIRETAAALTGDGMEEIPLLLLEVIYVVIAADRRVTAEESWLLNAVVAELAGSPDGAEAVEVFSKVINLDVEKVLDELRTSSPAQRQLAWRAAREAAVVDRDLARSERDVLRRIAEACGETFEPGALRFPA